MYKRIEFYLVYRYVIPLTSIFAAIACFGIYLAIDKSGLVLYIAFVFLILSIYLFQHLLYYRKSHIDDAGIYLGKAMIQWKELYGVDQTLFRFVKIKLKNGNKYIIANEFGVDDLLTINYFKETKFVTTLKLKAGKK